MTRGNQRDLAREKAAKRLADAKKGKGAAAHEGNAGLTMEQRKIRDADIMRQKQLAKLAAAGGGAEAEEGTDGGAGTSKK